MPTTKQVVKDFVAGLKQHAPSEAVAMLGVDADRGDLFQAHLEQACENMMNR